LKLYLDSSALIKRYIHETGSEKVMSLCAKADQLILSVLCVPEAVSAFCRLRREKQMTGDVYDLLKKDLQEDLQEALIVRIEPEIIEKSVLCLEKQALSTLDSIHLATALSQNCDLFLSADNQQRKAAQALGLKVEAV
jgi:predicted nucleic acid-binding protein